jgi:hypothetical protein
MEKQKKVLDPVSERKPFKLDSGNINYSHEFHEKFLARENKSHRVI